MVRSNIHEIIVKAKKQGPFVQSIVSVTSSLVVKMLSVLVSTISNSQEVLLKKNVSSFCKCKSNSQFFSKCISFSKNINEYVIFNDQSFNDTLNITTSLVLIAK